MKKHKIHSTGSLVCACVCVCVNGEDGGSWDGVLIRLKKNVETVLNQFSKTLHLSSLLNKYIGDTQGEFMLHDNQQLVLN